MKYNKPFIKDIELLALSDYSQYYLDNGIEVYELNFSSSAKVVKLELVYNAGRLYEQNKLSSKLSSALLKEGTSKFDSKSIANQLDFFGSYLGTSNSMDYSRINVLSLNKHFDKISDLVTDVIYNPSFSISEFDSLKRREKEKLKMQLAKNDVLGYRELTEKIFGTIHPYGYNSMAQDYDNIDINSVKEHHKNYYTNDNSKLFVSGNINDELRNHINNSIGSVSTAAKHDFLPSAPDFDYANGKIRIKGEQGIQKAIYIGGKLFERNHPDYFGMLLVNTILGGYFSSRLNKRIREREALTYGVGAQLDIMKEDGFFFISADIENQNEVPYLKAVYEELEILRTSLVPESELDNVKRYIKGQVLSSLDGPFKQIKVLQSMVINGIDPKKFTERVASIDMITPHDIQRLAEKYYAVDRLIEVVVEGESNN